MKKLLVISLLSSVLLSCSRGDDDTNQTPPTPENIKDVVISSYSKNYGYTGEEIIVYGENFPSIDKCKVYIGDKLVNVKNVSNDGKSLSFDLPNVETNMPQLKFVFENRNYTNNVSNKYNANIGIINKKVGEWAFATNMPILKSEYDSYQLQFVKNTTDIYYKDAGSTFSSLDGGITWELWDKSFFNSGFHPLSNKNGWSSIGAGIYKKDPENPLFLKEIFRVPGVSHSGDDYASLMYLEEDMKNGLLVSAHRVVYKTNDGTNFRKVYSNVLKTFFPLIIQRAGFKLDINHIWGIGILHKKDIATAENIGYGTIFYCNGNNENWSEYTFHNHPHTVITDIYFANENTGYCFLRNYNGNNHKIFKTNTGGNQWTELNIPFALDKNTSIAFTDEKTGYVSAKNTIYITKDGGQTWTLDYTTASNITRLGYANNSVYATSENGIMYRKFFK